MKINLEGIKNGFQDAIPGAHFFSKYKDGSPLFQSGAREKTIMAATEIVTLLVISGINSERSYFGNIAIPLLVLVNKLWFHMRWRYNHGDFEQVDNTMDNI